MRRAGRAQAGGAQLTLASYAAAASSVRLKYSPGPSKPPQLPQVAYVSAQAWLSPSVPAKGGVGLGLGLGWG